MRIAVEVEHDMYLPEWVLQAKAKGKLMDAINARMEGRNVNPTVEQVNRMRPNDKVGGMITVNKGNDDYLIIPSLGELSADEVKYLVGMYTEGGYGIGPKKRNISKSDWRKVVLNMADYLSESRKGRLY